ncbi:MAG: hypothetical protein ACJ8JD_04920 [Chthoniobacterales bacterium]
MSDAYRIAPLFVIRMAGVPFDLLQCTATPHSFRLARENSQELDASLAREVAAAREALIRVAQEALPPYLVFASAGFGERVASLLKTHGDFSKRNSDARKREKHLLLYLQRVCAKNDTFSEFGPTAWGSVADVAALEIDCASGIATRDAFFERWTAHAIAAAINADPDAPAKVAVPALEPHAFDLVVEDVRHWPESVERDRWLAVLDPLAELPNRFIATTDSLQRATIMDEARERFRQLGAARPAAHRALYAATNPIVEECARDCRFVVPQQKADEVTRDAEPWIDLWRDCYALIAHRVASALRRLLPDDQPVSLPEFLARAEANKMPLTTIGMVAPAAMAFAEIKAAFRALIAERADAAELQLTGDDCHFVRRNFDYPKFDEFTYPSADLQISAASVEAVNAGNYDWVISEFHPPVAILHHAFYWSCPDPAGLSREIEAATGGAPTFHYGFFAADFIAHTVVRQMDALPRTTFAAPQRPDPKWKRIDPADAEVSVDPPTGDVQVRVRNSGELLGSFARSWIIPLGFHPFSFGGLRHTPRLRCGNVIVQRRSWVVNGEEFGGGKFSGISADLVRAIERLRAERDLPRYVYIRPSESALHRSGAGRDKDTKPVFIDLESYLFVEIFYRWLAKSGELEVTEMLPDPQHLLWQEGDGRRTFELRTLIVPRT